MAWKQLGQMLDVSQGDRAKLADGARQDLLTARQHLIDHNCRLLRKEHFDEGASQGWILRMIDLERAAEGH